MRKKNLDLIYPRKGRKSFETEAKFNWTSCWNSFAVNIENGGRDICFTNCGTKLETFRLFKNSETIFILFYFILFFNNFPATTTRETVLNHVISHFVLLNKILSETRSIILVSCSPPPLHMKHQSQNAAIVISKQKSDDSGEGQGESSDPPIIDNLIPF